MGEVWILASGFFIIALVYSSVGFGGGSSYLTLLALPVFALPFPLIRATALCCNLVVVTGGVWIFYREGKISWRTAWPYLAGSVPLAFLAAQFPVRDREFFILLGAALAVAALLLWFQDGLTRLKKTIPGTAVRQAALGGGIGALSGLVGIGGGIFLSPLLHFLGWMEGRHIAALASVFILVNSLSSLMGLAQKGVAVFDLAFMAPLLAAVLAGGQIGSRLGARWFSLVYIRKATAVLIFVAAVNILFEWL
jgi:uncharacterized membrane protein YfcA